MGCCKEIGRFPCAAALLGVAQIGVQWTCFFFIMLLFLIFFPRHTPSGETESDVDEETNLPTWREAVLVLALSLAFFIFTFIGSIVFAYPLHDHVRGWANFLGLTGTLLAAIQYIPQIITTYRLQTVGSLSVPMMCIQTPGSFVFASSLAVRLGPGGWSAWGLFILTGCLQGCLLVMSLTFLWRERKTAKAENAITNESANDIANGRANNEQTPLLRNEVLSES